MIDSRVLFEKSSSVLGTLAAVGIPTAIGGIIGSGMSSAQHDKRLQDMEAAVEQAYDELEQYEMSATTPEERQKYLSLKGQVQQLERQIKQEFDNMYPESPYMHPEERRDRMNQFFDYRDRSPLGKKVNRLNIKLDNAESPWTEQKQYLQDRLNDTANEYDNFNSNAKPSKLPGWLGAGAGLGLGLGSLALFGK